MKPDKKVFIIGGITVAVLILIALVIAVAMRGNPGSNTTGNGSNPKTDTKTDTGGSFSSGTLDEMRTLFSNPATKEQALYEFTYASYLSDTQKADKLRSVRRFIEQKAAQGDQTALTIVNELTAYASQADNMEKAFQTKTCDQLAGDLFNGATAEEVKKTPWQYENEIANLASPDYVTDLKKRQDLVLHKKVLSQKNETGCKDLLVLAGEKAAALKKENQLTPPPDTATVIKNASRDLAGQDPVTTEPQPATAALQSPAIDFVGYQLFTNDLPTPPSSTVPLYRYYANLSYADVEELGKAFEMKERARKRDPETYVIEDKSGKVLEVKKLSGSFKYYDTDYWLMSQPGAGGSSEKVRTAQVDTSKAIDTTLSFLKKNKLLEGAYLKPETYQKQGRPSLFVEIHTGDPNTGMPPKLNGLQILNNIGSIAGDPSEAPSSENLLQDPSIVNTSDNTDGYSRPNDFNTITAEISQKGKLIGVEYNHRRVKSTLPAVPLKKADEALKDLNSGKGILGFVLPSPDTPASITQEQIFPANKATATTVRVDDVFLAYIYKPLFFSQEYLTPAYLFRGETKLESGYLVNYIVAVNAMKEAP